MKNNEFLKFLKSFPVSDCIIEWVKEKKCSWQYFYENCPKAWWLMLLFAKTNLNEENERTYFLVKGLIANTVRDKMTDKRSLDGVDAAIAYGEGKITKKEMQKANICAILPAYEVYGDAYKNGNINSEYIAAHAFAAAYACDRYCFYIISDIVAQAADNRTENEKLTVGIFRKHIPIWNIKL